MSVSGVDLIGYLASALVVLSLTMTSVVRLRIISLCGSIIFFTYGLLISAVPIMITNAAIAFVHVWFLRKEFSKQRNDLGVSNIRPDSPFLLDFIEFHLDDMRHFQPGFEMPEGDDVRAFLLTRDSLPAGLIVGRRIGDILHIELDYVVKAYRDSRLGKWVFDEGAEVFRSRGITAIRANGSTDTHARYLNSVGFGLAPRRKTGEFQLDL